MKSSNRSVQLTESGLKRVQAARRKYGKTVEDIVSGPDSPSINTVKRALRNGPVFLSTIERIWSYFQACAKDGGERLPALEDGVDYVQAELETVEQPQQPETAAGWICRSAPRPNRLFMGRSDVLAKLHSSLKAGPTALISDPQALTGLGGIGKTQTAIAYMYRFRSEYSRVFWVNADSIDAMNDGLAGLAEELGLLDATPADKGRALARMHDWFREQSNWLLVLDNADDIEHLSVHFPRCHNGALLLTTRARNTVKWAEPVPLREFSQEKGALFLLRRAGVLGVQQELGEASDRVSIAARDLSRELGGLPLALNQAGAYIAETGCTVDDYSEKYRRLGLELLDRSEEAEHASIRVTYSLALEQMARRSRYGAAAMEMMKLCALLAPDSIPEIIFRDRPFHQPGFDAPVAGPDHYPEIAATVCAYSLTSRNPETETITVHRLVQLATREILDKYERRHWVTETIAAVSRATPDFEFEQWGICDQLLPHWRLCADYIREYSLETGEAVYLLYQLGRYLRARALFEETESVLKLGLETSERVHGSDSPLTADLLDELACLYRTLDRGRESEPLHQRAVRIVEAALGPDHPQTASKLHNMALFYFQNEEYDTAGDLFRRSLAIREKNPDANKLMLAATLTQLAGIYRIQGRYDEAEPLCMRALQINERLHHPDHVDTATACNNLALLYLTMGRLDESDEYYHRALRINQKSRGPDHPETAHVIWGLARLRAKQNRFREADELFRKSVQIQSKNFGPTHARVAKIRQSYDEFVRGHSQILNSP